MTLTRLLTLAALSACLALPGSAVATEPGGGIAAPAAEPAAAEVSVETGADEPAPEAAQDETPTTPEGEEQPPDEENGDEQPPDEEDGDDTGGTGGTGGDTAGGSLPRTGFEAAALTAIGLGLLLAGAALWPTSSWPPPRDRLSRSAQRR